LALDLLSCDLLMASGNPFISSLIASLASLLINSTYQAACSAGTAPSWRGSSKMVGKTRPASANAGQVMTAYPTTCNCHHESQAAKLTDGHACVGPAEHPTRNHPCIPPHLQAGCIHAQATGNYRHGHGCSIMYLSCCAVCTRCPASMQTALTDPKAVEGAKDTQAAPQQLHCPSLPDCKCCSGKRCRSEGATRHLEGYVPTVTASLLASTHHIPVAGRGGIALQFPNLMSYNGILVCQLVKGYCCMASDLRVP
jgi:hypothetical protein